MTVKASIIQLVTENAHISTPVTNRSNLYTDLGFDSLSFVSLLTKIEDMYFITFSINEMEECLQFETLIKTIENKIKEREEGNDQAFTDQP